MQTKIGDEIFSWVAPEFRYYAKDFFWYWGSLLVALLLFGIALWQKNFLFAVFVAIAEFVVIQYGNVVPKAIRFSITRHGVRIGEQKLYSYEGLAGFAVSDELDGLGELFLQSKNKFSPVVKLHAYSYELGEIKTALGNFLPEIEYEETAFDAVAKLIRF